VHILPVGCLFQPTAAAPDSSVLQAQYNYVFSVSSSISKRDANVPDVNESMTDELVLRLRELLKQYGPSHLRRNPVTDAMLD
jgi:hypothetical protein